MRELGRGLRAHQLVAVAMVAAFAGCTSQGDAPDASLVVPPEDIHVVGTSNTIAHIEDIWPVADGAAWVLTSTDPYLVLLSAEGEELRVAGSRGGGPGELSWPTTLARDPGTGALVVFDPTLGKLFPVEAGTEEELAFAVSPGTPPIRLNSYEYLWTNNGGRTWLEGTERGFVFAAPPPGMPWIPATWHTDVVRLTLEGETEHVASTAELVGSAEERFAGAERFLPYPMWTSCPDGSLALYDPNRNQLRRLSADGVELAQHALPPEQRLSMNPERVWATVYPGVMRNRRMADPPGEDVLREAFRRDYTDREDEFADVFPEYAHLDCSSPDTLWLQRFDASAGQLGRGPMWLRVEGDGASGTVEFPSTFRPMRFHEGRIWGTHTGEFDVEYLAWTELSQQ